MIFCPLQGRELVKAIAMGNSDICANLSFDILGLETVLNLSCVILPLFLLSLNN